jgi:uncharacterized protein
MQIKKHPLLSPAIGTQREVVSFHYGDNSSGKKIYIQAALHADEAPGLLVAHHLRERLAKLETAQKLRCEVVIVPVANPIGLSQWLDHSHIGRFEFNSAENFNRHYPDVAEQVASRIANKLSQDSEKNARLIREALIDAVNAITPKTELASLRQTLFTLAADADITLDLHCDSEAALHLYTGSPLWDRVEPLARYMGAVATLLETTSGDNPFDEACSRTWWLMKEKFSDYPIPLGCVSVTVELRGSLDVTHAYATKDADAIINYLTHMGYIDGAAPVLPALIAAATPLAGSEAIETPVSGVVSFLREIGETIKVGDAVVDVTNPITSETITLTASTEGILYARDNRRFAHAGMRLCKIAGKVAFRTGKLLSA